MGTRGQPAPAPGRPEVLDLYEHHDRLHGGRRTDGEAVVNAWWQARTRGESVAIMAPTNETVVRLNQLAQGRGGPATSTSTVRRCRPDYRLFRGDSIATRHNDRNLLTDRDLMVKNRDRWTINAIHRGDVTVSGRTGTVRLPAEYVAEHLELAYAQTSHANQGRTVDRSLLFLDGPTDTRGVYVPMTRGRLSNEVFVALQGEQTAVDVVAQALVRDWIDQPAIARRAELAASPTATAAASGTNWTGRSCASSWSGSTRSPARCRGRWTPSAATANISTGTRCATTSWPGAWPRPRSRGTTPRRSSTPSTGPCCGACTARRSHRPRGT